MSQASTVIEIGQANNNATQYDSFSDDDDDYSDSDSTVDLFEPQVTASDFVFLHDMLHKTVLAHARRLALDCPGAAPRRKTLSYSLFWCTATAVARHTVRPLINGECIVFVLLPRVDEYLYVSQIAAMIGGAAFCCVDVTAPDEQLKMVLDASCSTIVLTDAVGSSRIRRVAPHIAHVVDVPKWCADNRKQIAAERIDRPLEPAPWMRAESLAYVIFTSGTTGKPKGVMIEHRSVITLLVGDLPLFQLGPGDRCGQSSSPAFDSSIEEAWVAFTTGATLVVLDHDTVRLGPDLPPWLQRERITMLWPTPTLLRSCICASPSTMLPDLRLLEVGGEMLPLDLAQQWCVGRILRNSYGPTEATITCFRWEITTDQKEIAIGKPLPGVDAWVLDDKLQPLADGELGELCVGGIYLARGYLNDPDNTAKRFVPHPTLGRIYRTGDLVKRDADGVYQCLGRIDTQVKIRGFRIELEAIEAHMSAHARVRAAACTVQEQATVKHLVGFVVLAAAAPGEPSDAATCESIRAAVRNALPEYMVPEAIEVIPELPTTVSGKTDRKRLPVINIMATNAADGEDATRAIVAPRTDSERAVAEAVASVLGATDNVSVEDDFFLHQGGNSLLAAQLVSVLRQSPETAMVTVRDIYMLRTIAALAKLVGSTGKDDVKRTDAGDSGKSFTSRGMGELPLEVIDVTTSGQPYPRAVFVAQTLVLLLLLYAISAATFAFLEYALPLVMRNFDFGQVVLITVAVWTLVQPVLLISLLLLTLLAKRLLIGRYVPGRYPIWGWFYFRHWIVQKLAQMMPQRFIQGTVFQIYVLRALGMHIGHGVHIQHLVRLDEAWDLVHIGNDVSLNVEAAIVSIEFEAGQMIIGPVHIGDGVTLDTRAGVGSSTVIGDGAYITALSYVPRNVRVPPRTRFDGVPAANVGDAPPTPEATSDDWVMPELLHGTLMTLGRLSDGVVRETLLTIALLAIGIDTENDDEFVTVDGVLFACGMAVLALPLDFLFKGLVLRFLGRLQPGVFSRYSYKYVLAYSRMHAVEQVATFLGGSRMLPLWLRLAGARIDEVSELDYVYDTLPELFTLGKRSFFASGIYAGCPVVHRGMVRVGDTRVGNQVYMGNHAVIPPGTTVPDGTLLGVATVAEPEIMVEEGKSWFGVPPFELPQREVVVMDESVTYKPSLGARAHRWCWELMRFWLPLPTVALTAGTGYAYYRFHSMVDNTVLALCVQPAIVLLDILVLLLLNVALKWILMGKVRPGVHAFWSSWTYRWDFLFSAWSAYAAQPLHMLEGTLWLNCYLRLMGSRIGSRVFLNHYYTQLPDPDMVWIDDDATVCGQMQAHTFEDRVLKVGRVHIRSNASVGASVIMLYGADIGEETILVPHSVVMKAEVLLPYRIYGGAPSQPIARLPKVGVDQVVQRRRVRRAARRAAKF